MPFVTAMRKAEKLNHDRYCKLFGIPNLTFQILDNPYVKEDYEKANCGPHTAGTSGTTDTTKESSN
jgi:hypothetical protein